MDEQWVGDGFCDRHFWIEAGEGVLKNHLQGLTGLP